MALPGRIAGASLKLIDVDAVAVDDPALPGRIAGASLKRRWLDRLDPREALRSPRQNRRGLIEAVNIAGARIGGTGELSPAESPGPH